MNTDRLREICSSLPAVTEDVKWGNDLVFSVGDRMFCAASLEPPFTCSFKVKDEEFEELCSQNGFMPAPYMARAKWILVTDPAKLSREEWKTYIKQSYELVKMKLTKKLREQLRI